MADLSHPRSVKRDSAPRADTMREMEAADWASLSDQELLERRSSKRRTERLKSF
jgi:hypothetical protein